MKYADDKAPMELGGIGLDVLFCNARQKEGRGAKEVHILS